MAVAICIIIQIILKDVHMYILQNEHEAMTGVWVEPGNEANC